MEMDGDCDGTVNEAPGGKERTLPLAVCMDLIAYAGYYLSNLLFLLLSLPLVAVFTPFPRFRDRLFLGVVHRYARFLTQSYLPGLGVCRIVRVSGIEHRRPGGPFVYVANHRGRLDALLLAGMVKDTTVLIKAKDRKSVV